MYAQHHRFAIWSISQHPYKHTLAEFAYANASLPTGSVVNTQQALDWVIAVLYPQTKPAVANIAALPAVGNTLNDYRVVQDNGAGKSQGYRWEQREGEAAPSWHLIQEIDWGADSVLQAWEQRTQYLWVMKTGYDDLDNTGAKLTGINAGQHIFGGQAASSNLSLHANAGDGAGAVTGYVQVFNHFRPTSDNTFDTGTAALSWRTGYFKTSVVVGTTTLTPGALSDSGGAFSFGTNNVTANSVTATGAVSSFKTGTTVGTLTLANGSITDGGGAISFGANNLSTTGSLTVGNTSITSGAVTTSAGGLTLNAFSGTVTVSAATLACAAVTATSYTRGNTVLTDGQLTSGATTTLTFVSTTLIHNATTVRPSADATTALGDATHRYTSLFLSTGIGDGTNSVSIATLLSLRAINTGVATGYGIFYNGTQWVAADPDTEVFHDSISHLTGVGTDGDAGHSQFVVAAGRAVAQTIKGGTGASANLTLDSTSNATKGSILCNSKVSPAIDATYDLGASAARWVNLYMSGQAIGLRVENYATAGAPAAGNAGRLYWDTTVGDLYVDNGAAWKLLSSLKYYNQDAAGWTGSVAAVTYDVSSVFSATNPAYKALWQFQDNSNNRQVVQGALISFPSATQVTVTFDQNLAAGTYTLVGIG